MITIKQWDNACREASKELGGKIAAISTKWKIKNYQFHCDLTVCEKSPIRPKQIFDLAHKKLKLSDQNIEIINFKDNSLNKLQKLYYRIKCKLISFYE